MSFGWIPIYSEIAHRVLDFEKRQGELLSLRAQMAAEGMKVVRLTDQDAARNAVPLTEIHLGCPWANWVATVIDVDDRLAQHNATIPSMQKTAAEIG